MADNDIKSDWNSAYKQAMQIWGTWLTETKSDLQWYLGDQWSDKDKRFLDAQQRNALSFNRIRRVVKLITGFQRKNRLAMTINPVEGSDEQTANLFSMLVQHIAQREAYIVMSDAFEGSLKTAINLVDIYRDFTNDPVNGDFRFKRIPFNRFLVDPNFSDRLLSDAQYVLRREWLTKTAIKPLLPMVGPGEIDKIHIRGRDDKFIIATPQAKDLFGKDLCRYDEFYVKKTRPIKYLIDTLTGDQKVWKGNGKQLEAFLKQFPFIHVIDRQETYVEKNILVEDVPVWQGEDPMQLGPDFSFIPVICFYDPEYEDMRWKLQGIVRCMKDPQTESNKRRSKMLDILDSQPFPYKLIEEDALVNKDQAYASGQGQPLFLKSGALGKGKVDIRPAPDIPQGLFRLMEVLDKDIDEIPGANAELFGTPENENLQMAGFLSKLRQSAGLTVLQDIFDNYRIAKKTLGMRLIKLIQNHWTTSKIERITNMKATREFFDKNFGLYDCVPAEGVLTDTQRHTYFAQLITLKEMGAPIPWAAILDAAPIEQKQRLKEMVQQAEQAQAQAMQMDVQERQLTQQLKQTKAMSDIAKSQENRAQAVENMANATLDRIRTLKEIGKLDDEHVQNLISLIDWVRGVESGERIAPAAQGGGRRGAITRR